MKGHLLLNNSLLLPPDRVCPPNAWAGHIPFAMWLVAQVAPKILVELGTHSGNSYFAFCQAVRANGLATRCHAVDTWQGDPQAGCYGDEVYRDVVRYNQEHYADFSTLHRRTFDEAAALFSDGSIDILHIDGMHTYEAVRHDFETWFPKLSEMGVVLFHDTAVRTNDFGVWRLFAELGERFPGFCFEHSNGLGVLLVGREIPPALAALYRAWQDPADRSLIDGLFGRLGEVPVLRLERDEMAGQIEQLHSQLAESRQQLVESRQQLAESRQQLVESRQQLKARETDLALIRASRSWRVTRPLRWCGRQGKRLGSLGKQLPLLLRQRGGITRTLRKGVAVFRREGLAGLRQRLLALAVEVDPVVDRNAYGEWLRRYDTLTDKSRSWMRARMEAFAARPLFSVLMPTYNPGPEWLVEAIESVRRQLYPHWQLCIADDASTDPAVRAILTRYAAADARIKVVFRKSNGHISAASNSALELAEGEWVALLDQDDLLSEHALFWVAEAINRAPDCRLIYSDEDKIDATGQRFAPYFKCDWNEDLFYSHNLVTHLGVYHAALLREVSGFREGLEGAQDYDLALRCLERIGAGKIHHIPRVLYHWRMHPESTAQSSEAKPYALLAGERALNEHFQRLGSGAKAELLDFGMYRVRYPLPAPLPLVSLIIPTRNGLTLLRQCVESILQKTTYPRYEILIVDNGSDDPAILDYFTELAAEARVRVVRDERPFNYSALNNSAVRLARGSIVGLINNDVEVITPEWLSEMVSHAVRPEIGAVGARLWYPDDTCQHGGVILGIGGVAGHAHKYLPKGQHGYFGRASLIQALSAVTGACLVIRKEIYEEVGGLDEKNLRVAFNDIDFCLRVREAGYRNLWTPYAELYHHESASRGIEDTPEKQARLAREVDYMKVRWGDRLRVDPAYSPNLTLSHEDFSLAWPPRVELYSGTTF